MELWKFPIHLGSASWPQTSMKYCLRNSAQAHLRQTNSAQSKRTAWEKSKFSVEVALTKSTQINVGTWSCRWDFVNIIFAKIDQDLATTASIWWISFQIWLNLARLWHLIKFLILAAICLNRLFLRTAPKCQFCKNSSRGLFLSSLSSVKERCACKSPSTM